MVARALATPLLSRVTKPKRSTKSIRGQVRPEQAVEQKTAFGLLMMRRPGAQRTKHKQDDEYEAATNY